MDPHHSVKCYLVQIMNLLAILIPSSHIFQGLLSCQKHAVDLELCYAERQARQHLCLADLLLDTVLVSRKANDSPCAVLILADWRSETADFYSAPEDVHSCRNVVAEHPAHALPFCSTACNSEALYLLKPRSANL